MLNKSFALAVLTALLLIFSSLMYAQEPPMLNFTMADGLPSNNVYQIYRDSRKFLWFATDKGVARYNGIKFEVFTTFNGLPDNEIFFFREDLCGRLWLGTYNGDLCYYKDDTFHTALNTPFLKLPFNTYHTRLILPQKDSSILVFYYNPAKLIDIQHEKCKVIDISGLLKNETYGTLIYRQKLSTNRYLLTFNNKAIVIDSQAHIEQSLDIDTMTVTRNGTDGGYSACQNQDHFYNRHGVYNTDWTLVKALPHNFSKENIINQVFFSLNYSFYATDNGLFIDDTVHLLRDQNVSSVSNDNIGNYWISTLTNGVYVLRKDFYHTKIYKNAYEGKIRFAKAYGGHLFFTTANNNLYDIYHNKMSCLLDCSKIKQDTKNIPVETGALIDSNYGYHNTYKDYYISLNNVFSAKIRTEHNDMFRAVKNIKIIGDYVYLCRSNSIVRFKNTKTNPNTPLIFQTVNAPLKDDRIFGYATDKDNKLWYSTIKSVYKIYDTTTVLQPQLSVYSFKYFKFLGNSLVGYTYDNQLLVCSNPDGTPVVDSVPNDNCIWDKFYKLDNKHILISTNNYYRMLTIDDTSQPHSSSLSIIYSPFIPLQAEAITVDKQYCYFLKDRQISQIDINSLLEAAIAPRLRFNILKAGNKIYPIRKEVYIPFADSKNITLSFSTVAFGGDRVVYQYSVSKKEKDNWIQLKGEEISLINSGYGTFTIKVRAKTVASDFCKPVEFTLIILRPFWATWWFISIGVAVVLGLIIVAGKQRIAYALNKKDKEHDMTVRFLKSEYKALNALMNPHFIFNTLNNVQGLINKNDKLGANEYLRIIADLIRQNMHNISKELIPLQKEMDLVSNYLLLEKLRFKEKLNYSIIIEKGLDISDIMVPPLLIQPLVENSIKHGILPLESTDGTIYINIYERKNVLYIEVRDNGVGINYVKDKTNPEHESFGLENIRKRIEQLSIIQNKEITFNFSERKNTTGKLQWTTVTVSMVVD